MAITIVNAGVSSPTTTGAASLTVTGVNIPAGLLIYISLGFHATVTLSSITGTYAGVGSFTSISGTTGAVAYLANCPAMSSGDTIILNFSGSTGAAALVSTFGGVLGNDVALSAKANTSGTNTSNTITANTNSDLIIATFGSPEASSVTYTPTAPFSSLANSNNGGTTSTKAAVQTTTNIVTAGFSGNATITPSSAAANEMIISAFSPRIYLAQRIITTQSINRAAAW